LINYIATNEKDLKNNWYFFITIRIQKLNFMIIKNNFRQFYKTTFLKKIKSFFLLFRAKRGKNIFIGKNVSFERFLNNLKIGSNVIIKDYSRICVADINAKIDIGNNTSIGHHTFIFSKKNITIGENCMIAPFVYMVDSDHNYNDKELLVESNLECKDIIIEDNVWIGAHAIILKGTIIGTGSVIGAGSVVKGSVQKNSVVAGNPFRVLKTRDI